MKDPVHKDHKLWFMAAHCTTWNMYTLLEKAKPTWREGGRRGSTDKDQVIKCNAIYFLSIWSHLYSLNLGDEWGYVRKAQEWNVSNNSWKRAVKL